MTASGTYPLGSFTVTSADEQVGNWVENFEGIAAALFHLRFAYGSDGADSPSVRAFVQTTFDNGETARDIACILFEAASETSIFNISGETPVTTPVGAKDGELSDDTVVSGLLGTKFRLKVISVGTYSNSTLLVGHITVR